MYSFTFIKKLTYYYYYKSKNVIIKKINNFSKCLKHH